jgi:hypothetical protein
MRNTADVTGGKPIAVLLQSISGVSAINPFGRLLRHPCRKGAILLFCPVFVRCPRDTAFSDIKINSSISSIVHSFIYTSVCKLMNELLL